MLTEIEQPKPRIDGLTLVAIAFIIFIIYNILKDRSNVQAADLPNNQAATSTNLDEQHVSATEITVISDPASIDWPYEQYTITQGPHGNSYGHMAIDLAAGKGTVVKSPINGTVTDRFMDEWGNPTLVIENEIYRILLLHGEYTVNIGDIVTIGQPVGVESNLGYTTDMRGVPCKNRNCGYHTHLNIFDKRLGENVNPLEVLAEKN